MSASGETTPIKLPRSKPMPASLRLSFTSEALNSPAVPELSRIVLAISHNLSFQTVGLPSCPLSNLYSTYASARQTCAGSLVGHGGVTSEVTLPGHAPATINGRLFAFYAFAEGKPRILAQVISNESLPLTYVIPFELKEGAGAFGTRLVVQRMRLLQGVCRRVGPNCFAQPYTLKGVYGRISSFELSLHRLYIRAGKRESFVSADCPVPGKRPEATFPIAQITLNYAGREDGAEDSLATTVNRKCRVSTG